MWIRWIVNSLKKSSKLRRLSRELGRQQSPEKMMAEALSRALSGEPSRRDIALQELLDLCEADEGVATVMAQHGATRDTLEHIYRELVVTGAGQWEAGHFVAASTLAFGFTLDYALRHFGADADHSTRLSAAVRLLDYFRHGNCGPVE